MYSFKKSIQPTKTALDRTNSNMLLSCWEYDSSLNSVASYGVLAVWPVVDPKVEKSTCIQIKSGNSISELSLGVFRSVWRQTTQYFICSELSKFLFSTPRTESNQIFWWCSLAGCLCSESDANPGMQRLSPVTKTTRISEW